LRGFVLGVFIGILMVVVGGYLLVRGGGVSMATTATPLPLEKTVATIALRASIGNAGDQKNPLPFDDTNMLAGMNVYKEHCVVCHGVAGKPPTAISKGMFPPPPQLFEKDGMVTDDAEGVSYWKVTHGIRLSGMPGFGSTLSDNERWQVTMLAAHADKLPRAVELNAGSGAPR
jgi:mono/diheme cytochrome c family protein